MNATITESVDLIEFARATRAAHTSGLIVKRWVWNFGSIDDIPHAMTDHAERERERARACRNRNTHNPLFVDAKLAAIEEAKGDVYGMTRNELAAHIRMYQEA